VSSVVARAARRVVSSCRQPAADLALATIVLAGIACDAHAPPHGVEETCAFACAAKAPECTFAECQRGCNLALDRLVEGETSGVLTCVVRQIDSCGDRVWAHCAARVGPYADGGPPPPATQETDPP
jgi:hypothetical protein